MQWVLHILQKHLANEKKWLQITVHDLRSKEGQRMAKERVPQLEKAIEILKQTPDTQTVKTLDKPKRQRTTKTQLSLWQLLNP